MNKAVEKEIEALTRMDDSSIDTSDIPPVADWSQAVIGKFYRPRRRSRMIQRWVAHPGTEWDAFATRHPWFEVAVAVGLCVLLCLLDARFSKDVKPQF